MSIHRCPLVAISGADVTACTVDVSGAFIIDSAAVGCTARNKARASRGAAT